MFTIDIILQNTAASLSVQRKEAEGAEALYKEITQSMGSTPKLLHLTCEKDTDKKVAILSDRISSVIVSQKSGAAAAGRVPGFFSTPEE
jgi:hypothetical protein